MKRSIPNYWQPGPRISSSSWFLNSQNLNERSLCSWCLGSTLNVTFGSFETTSAHGNLKPLKYWWITWMTVARLSGAGWRCLVNEGVDLCILTGICWHIVTCALFKAGRRPSRSYHQQAMCKSRKPVSVYCIYIYIYFWNITCNSAPHWSLLEGPTLMKSMTTTLPLASQHHLHAYFWVSILWGGGWGGNYDQF